MSSPTKNKITLLPRGRGDRADPVEWVTSRIGSHERLVRKDEIDLPESQQQKPPPPAPWQRRRYRMRQWWSRWRPQRSTLVWLAGGFGAAIAGTVAVLANLEAAAKGALLLRQRLGLA